MPINLLAEVICDYCGRKDFGRVISTLPPHSNTRSTGVPWRESKILGPERWEINLIQDHDLQIRCEDCVDLARTKSVFSG